MSEIYKVLDVADYIIRKCNEDNRAISNLKLQKILYFVQAEFLVTKNRPCFMENIQAWDFGVVVPKVYYKYKIYGGTSIPYIERNNICRISQKDREIIDDVINECSKYSAASLTELTQNQSPWEDYYIVGQQNIIPHEAIKEFFM